MYIMPIIIKLKILWIKIYINLEYLEFVEQLKIRVSESRYQAARSVNSELIKLYHHIGNEILKRQEKYGWGAKNR